VAFEPTTVSDTVAKLVSPHALAKLINFPDHILAEHEWRLQAHGLRIEVPPDGQVCVFQRIVTSVYSRLEASTCTRTSPGPPVGKGASAISSPSGPPKLLT
jgi:hypothetical protein